MASIRLANIVKDFPGVRALDDVNLDIESGEFFTLLGPSGCGKTTLLRIVAGFYQQDNGSVYVDGKRIDRVPAYSRNTGMVFQNYAVFPHMTVFENVAFGLHNRKVSHDEIRKRVDRILSLARLSGFEKRTPDQLSGGQQQRVGLARAMVIEPQVLLMDEPLSNLDAKLRLQMREEIRDIQRQLGTTTVYVTHDQEEALVISDRIAVMDAGVVEQVGTPWEVYKTPQTVFVASFVGHMNLIDARLQRSQGGVVLEIGKERTQVVRSFGSEGEVVTDVLVGARPEDIEIVESGEEELGAIRMRASVAKSTFTGPLVQYTLETEGGIKLLAERHRPNRSGILREGSAVTACIPEAAIHYFDRRTRRRVDPGSER